MVLSLHLPSTPVGGCLLLLWLSSRILGIFLLFPHQPSTQAVNGASRFPTEQSAQIIPSPLEKPLANGLIKLESIDHHLLFLSYWGGAALWGHHDSDNDTQITQSVISTLWKIISFFFPPQVCEVDREDGIGLIL